MSMHWVGCLNQNLHIIQVRLQVNRLPLPVTVRPSISGWGCILMTASRSRRCRNTLYVNGKDLMRV